MRKRRILLFSEPDGSTVLQQALGGVYDLAVARTEGDAVGMLQNEQFDMIISRVFFEHEDPFHFLHWVRSNPKTSKLPFVLFSVRQTEYARQLRDPVQKSFAALGAQGYLTLDEYCDDVKCDYARLREDIARLFPQVSSSFKMKD